MMAQTPLNGQSMECRTFGTITGESWVQSNMALQLHGPRRDDIVNLCTGKIAVKWLYGHMCMKLFWTCFRLLLWDFCGILLQYWMVTLETKAVFETLKQFMFSSGDSYIILKDVRLRCTLSPQDSANLPARRWVLYLVLYWWQRHDCSARRSMMFIVIYIYSVHYVFVLCSHLSHRSTCHQNETPDSKFSLQV